MLFFQFIKVERILSFKETCCLRATATFPVLVGCVVRNENCLVQLFEIIFTTTMAAGMKHVNPYVLHNILDKLLEAAQRSMWQADEDMPDTLHDAYLDAEGEIEEVTDG